ncbi:MAG TPA: rRNA maturation RNase YbeY [Gemmatimonadales bacterium]|jgi:probable rRNA maturation factor
MARPEPEVHVNGALAGLPSWVIDATVRQVLRRERRDASVHVTFVGKRVMSRLNHRYLGHRGPTDVLSFPLLQRDGGVAGDIYICRYAAARNARDHGAAVRHELLRLVVHGTLHLLGCEHPAGAGRTRSAMWHRQERHLASLAWLN